jgi:AcrR family transcriptional regulator
MIPTWSIARAYEATASRFASSAAASNDQPRTPTTTSDSRRPNLRADARRNRERVLAAATKLFACDGLGVPLDEIARHAGVGPGTVHSHFPSKEDLFAAVAISRLQAVVEQARDKATAEDPAGALTDQLSQILAEGDDSLPFKSALAGTELDLQTTAPEVYSDLRDAIERLLTRAQDNRTIRTDLDIDDLMALLAGAFRAVQYAKLEARSERAHRLTAVLFDGLKSAASD